MRSLPALSLGIVLICGTCQVANAEERAAPAVSLGKPQPVSRVAESPASQPIPGGSLVTGAFIPDNEPGGILLTQAPDGVPPPPPIGAPPGAGAGNEAFNCGVVTQNPNAPTGFWAGVQNWCKGATGSLQGNGRKMFQSDRCFENFISPVSNPFYFEDPRSLTELRPVFLFQSVPGDAGGGRIFDFALQGRLALTEQFSIVIHKLGLINYNNSTFGDNGTSFQELWLGPKWTFYRNENSGTVVATGLIFEIPTGSEKVAQNTGHLSLAPYLSAAQRLYKFADYGTLNGMGTVGYSFATDSERSDHFYTSLHLDFDVGNLHKFYPIFEMNWFNYTKNGSVTPINVEGRDLINFGATNVKGVNELSLVPGFRYKVNDFWQVGFAAEFPVAGQKDLMNYRIGFDMIFRY